MVLGITLDGRPEEIQLGAVGDQLVLGDWDCDGADTPALYQAASGVVHYFDVWPSVEQQSYPPSGTEQVAVGGTASLAAGEDDGCDRVAVDGVVGEAGAGAGAADASEVAFAPRPTGPVR